MLMPISIMLISDNDDRTFMERLYCDNYRLMYATAWRIVNDAEAIQDIVSDACEAIIGKLQLLKTLEDNKARMYIVSIVRNQAIDYLRKCRCDNKIFSFGTDEDLISTVADSSKALEDEAVLKSEICDVMNAILRLPQKEQEAITLKYLYNMSDVEIAERTCLSPASVRKYIGRARSKIKELVYKELNI